MKPCGTYAACARHIRRGETPCEPCYAAQRSYYRVRRSVARGSPLQVALLGEVIAVLAGAMEARHRDMVEVRRAART